MKSIPPPLPTKKPTLSRPMPQTAPIASGSDQSLLMIGGLVALLLFVLGLLIVIVTLIGKGDASSGTSAGVVDSSSSEDSSVIGEDSTSATDSENPAEAVAPSGRDTVEDGPAKETEAQPKPAPSGTEAEESRPSESSEAGTPDAENEPKEEKPMEDAETELPKGMRVFPLYSEPSAATAQSLEASNPFLDAGKANSTVFVIDKSSSMSGRLERVIAALREAIERLDSKQSFQLFFFDSVPHQHPNLTGLVKATKQNKVEILAWADAFVSAGGGTEPLAAVLRAIELKPDRIVILSEGEFDPNYVDAITKANSGKPKDRIRIDCIGLDEVVESLRQIAKLNGPGVYYQAK